VKSYRVFLWPRASGSWELLAIGQHAKSWTRESFGSGEFFWIPPTSPATTPTELIDRLNWALPPSSLIHVFASPDPQLSNSDLAIGGKKLLSISHESGLRDYAEIAAFLAAPSFSAADATPLLSTQIEKLSDRVLDLRLRAVHTRPAVVEASLPKERFQRLWDKSRRPQKLLLHVCCGPDAAGVVQQLKSEYELSCFWYDPNIQPRQEYDKRLAAFVKVMEIEGVPYTVGDYDVNSFLEKIKGLEHTPEQGAKCSKCYDMRLEQTASLAHEKNFDLYATTLAISPHKVQQKLVAFGELNEKRFGVPYLHRNFMKDDGFTDSVEYTRAHGIFRQDYCGCWFSLHEGGSAAKWLAESLQLTSTSHVAPAALSDETFQNYERRLEAQGDSDYSGG
jgi:epoxyqueuosine reductase